MRTGTSILGAPEDGLQEPRKWQSVPSTPGLHGDVSVTDSLPFEQLQYEFQEIWDEDWFPREDYERVQKVATLIPDHTETLLDVGCGNGLFLNHLKRQYSNRFRKLVGVDRSEAALEHVETETALSNIDRLLFSDLQFDTVTCMEVLEHLPLPTYSKAVAELARVAKQSIIISVPYKQNLKASQCQCPTCLTCFNPDYHVRSFNEDTLRSLFLAHSFEIAGTYYVGEQIVRYDSEVRASVRCLFGRTRPAFPSYAICPVCGFFDRNKLAEDLANRKRVKLIAGAELRQERRPSAIRRLVSSWFPKRIQYRWVVATYERKA
jgi:SAM-dependent methyltransferase